MELSSETCWWLLLAALVVLWVLVWPWILITVKATIKDHGEYKGCKHTTLARVTALSSEEVVAEVVKMIKGTARAAKKVVKGVVK